jgi:hypothetical protein
MKQTTYDDTLITEDFMVRSYTLFESQAARSDYQVSKARDYVELISNKDILSDYFEL